MNQHTHEPVEAGVSQPPSERSTGLVFAGVAAALAVWLHENPVALALCLAASVLFLALALLRPALLGPLNRLWFRFSLLLHRIVSPVVMLAIFALVFVPAGLLMRALRDPLRRRRAPAGASYWVARDRQADALSSMKNQF